MHRPVLRFLHRLFVWLGIAAVGCAGGTAPTRFVVHARLLTGDARRL